MKINRRRRVPLPQGRHRKKDGAFLGIICLPTKSERGAYSEESIILQAAVKLTEVITYRKMVFQISAGLPKRYFELYRNEV